MDENKAKRVIRCTPENVGDMRAVVAGWPQLNNLVKGLQAQNLFPGLRALEITLTGSDSFIGKGLGAVPTENAPKGI